MDIARPSNARQKKIRRAIYGAVGVVAVGLITLGLSRLQPAAPSVERATVWIDTVKRGPMVRQVHGLGTLVPEDIRWIPATTMGRVELIVVKPGTSVKANTVILELSNPTLQQELQDARLKLQGAEAGLTSLRVQLENERLSQQAATASAEADFKNAALQLDVDQKLAAQQIVSQLKLSQSKLDAELKSARFELSKKQLASQVDSMQARIDVQQSQLEQMRALMQLKQQQVDELHVRAGVSGVLQVVPVEVGQQVAPGEKLARVADPSRLKAELKIAETQTKDVQIGQVASIDTRNGIVSGKVVRIDPSVQNGTRTVDVTLDGALPKGAVADSSVDGTIELERLADVLFVGRPAFGQEQATVGLFKLQNGGGEASRVQVKLGRSSVNNVEVVSGLNVGDQVVLSDMSAWDAFDRVRLQ